jgi:hypothetical protein
MSSSTKKLTRSALLAALGLVLMYLAAVIPTAKLAFVAVAGLLTAAVLINCGTPYSLGVFLVTAVLSLIILPMKSVAVLYACFFGYYPIAKSWMEHVRNLAVSWVLKLLLFNLVFVALWLFAAELLAEALTLPHMWVVAQLIGNAAFILYDICVSRLILFYITKISKHMK